MAVKAGQPATEPGSRTKKPSNLKTLRQLRINEMIVEFARQEKQLSRLVNKLKRSLRN
jgi:siroheme synthase